MPLGSVLLTSQGLCWFEEEEDEEESAVTA